MHDLPTPKLGNITAMTIKTPDLDRSVDYWSRLGYKELFRAEWPFPWVQMTDGQVLIMLRLDPKPYIALTYYVPPDVLSGVVSDLEVAGINFVSRTKPSDVLQRFVMQSPDGQNISLVGITEGFSQPPGPTMLTMAQSDYMKPEKYTNQVCGMYGEFAHPVADLDKALEFWQKLGFKAISRFTHPYPWCIASDGLAIVGLHQTVDFTQPTITYFASDMKQKIEAIKQNGLTDFDDKNPSNTVLTTPEDQRVNLFGMGM